MSASQLKELVIQSLQHEMGGVLVYETAVQCAVNPSLKQEWQKYLEQTRKHVEVTTTLCKDLGFDPKEETPGRKVVAHVGNALVQAMKMAQEAGDPAGAELVACECVVLAETKDHADWELIGRCAVDGGEDTKAALKKAYDQVEDEEDEHLYHTKGWCRELWMQSLGLKAELPPPEEVRQVKSAIGAAKAQAESLAHR